jgi:hypothetical protein
MVLAFAFINSEGTIIEPTADGDGIVNFLDFAVVAENWPTSVP